MIKNVVFLAVLALAVQAQPTIGQRKVNQQARINQGVRSGELTRPEAARLNAQQAELRQQVRQDRRDGGGLTTAERVRIQREQNQQSRRIARQKTDAQVRR